jgi:predicted N-acetyltransferase YhbS
MAVLSQYQKQKIGYKLLQILLEFARQNQYEAVHLASASDWKTASRFYERCGFERGKVICFSKPSEEGEPTFTQIKSKTFENIKDLTEDDWKEIDRPP